MRPWAEWSSRNYSITHCKDFCCQIVLKFSSHPRQGLISRKVLWGPHLSFKMDDLSVWDMTSTSKKDIWGLPFVLNIWTFFKDFIYLFLEREGREKQRERNINVWEKHQLIASHMPPVGDLALNPGVCPDGELNQWPFSLQDDVRPTEPHQSRLSICIFRLSCSYFEFLRSSWEFPDLLCLNFTLISYFLAS